MNLKYNPNEPIEVWAQRVRTFELGRAMMQIAQGEDTEEVMKKMSDSITNKLLHPFLVKLKSHLDKDHEI